MKKCLFQNYFFFYSRLHSLTHSALTRKNCVLRVFSAVSFLFLRTLRVAAAAAALPPDDGLGPPPPLTAVAPQLACANNKFKNKQNKFGDNFARRSADDWCW